jgi:subtilase family serine protease
MAPVLLVCSPVVIGAPVSLSYLGKEGVSAMKFWRIAAAAALLGFAAPAFAAGGWRSTHAALTTTSVWAGTATQAVNLAGMAGGRGLIMSRLSDSVPLRIVVGLASNRAAADAYLRHQTTPGDPLFHKFLTPAQFTAMFNPSRTQALAVASYLAREGFSNIAIEPNNLIVSGVASPSRAEAAFHTTIQATVVNGRVLYGNVTPAQIPSQLRGLVTAVLGLNNVYQMRTHVVPMSAFAVRRQLQSAGTLQTTSAHTPPPCLVVTAQNVCTFGEYGPKQYQLAYDACPNTCTGYNTTVAVMAEGNVTQVLKDLRTAEAYWGLPHVPYTAIQVGVSSVDTSGLDEWDLDTQISSGIAQTVKHLYVYHTTSLTDSDITLEYSHWVNDDLAIGGNSSFGEPESLAYADGSMEVDDALFNQAASQGQTMFASTGDNGEGCPVLAATGVPNSGVPEVCYPAASPYVVAVGGTTLDTNAVGATGPCTDCGQPGTYYGEHVWVGTGGGVSKWETAPYWQTNGIVASATAGRAIADISMCADNNGCPMDVFVNGAQIGVGGTSLSSPMSMGVWARLQTMHANKLGFAAPVYYGIYGKYEPCPLGSTGCTPAEFPTANTAALPPDTTEPIGGFHDVLFGSNGIPSTAAPGWDTPTGLGSVDICVMQKDITNSIFSGH